MIPPSRKIPRPASLFEIPAGDSLEKVEDFYKRQLPKSTITTEENQCTIIASTSRAMITIVMERQDDKTIIRMAKTEATNTGAAKSE